MKNLKLFMKIILFTFITFTFTACNSGQCNNNAGIQEVVMDSNDGGIANNATNVPLKPIIVLKFIQPMDAATINNTTIILITEDGTSIPISQITSDSTNTRFYFTPASPLQPGTKYNVKLTSGIQTAIGTPIKATSFSFSTTTTPDVTPPTVSIIEPNNGGQNISLAPNISIMFSESVQNVNTSTVTIHEGSITGPTLATSAIVAGENNTYSLSSAVPLKNNTTYYVALSDGITDMSGNSLAPTSFDFTTNSIALYIAPISAKVGESFNLDINFTNNPPTNDNPYTIVLPEGLTTEDSSASSYSITSTQSIKKIKVAANATAGIKVVEIRDKSNNIVSYINIPVAILKNMFYMATYSTGGKGIYSCQYDISTGNATTPCTNETQFGDLNSSAIAINSTGTVAYGGGRFSGSTGDIRVCQINNTYGADFGKFTSCSTVNIPNLSGAGVFGIALNQQQTKIYIGVLIPRNGNSIFACDISPTNPTPSNCVNQTNLDVKDGVGRMTINYSGNTIIFNNDSKNMYTCSILSNGNIDNCQSQLIQYSGSSSSYAAPGFSYDNTKIFTVGRYGRVSYVSYNQQTKQNDGIFNNGLTTPITDAASYLYLTAVSFGPTGAFISAAQAPAGVLYCPLDLDGKLATCNPWSYTSGINNIDNIFVFD